MKGAMDGAMGMMSFGGNKPANGSEAGAGTGKAPASDAEKDEVSTGACGA